MSDAEFAAEMFPTMVKAPVPTESPTASTPEQEQARLMFPSMFPPEKPAAPGEHLGHPSPPQAPPAAGTPVADLAAPEGVDPAAFADFKTLASKVPGLDAAKAGDLVALHQRALAARDEAWDGQVAAWEEEIREHPQFGGERLEETRDLANDLIDRFGTPALRDLIRQPAYGSCAPLIMLLAEVSAAMRDGRAGRRR